MTASLGILVIRSSLVDWRSMKKECRHARHSAGTTGRYSTGETPPIKAEHPEPSDHLRSTCTGINTIYEDLNESSSARLGGSQQLEILPSPNSKRAPDFSAWILIGAEILEAQQFCWRGNFTRCGDFKVHLSSIVYYQAHEFCISEEVFRRSFPQQFSAAVFRRSFPQKFSAAVFRRSFPQQISAWVFCLNFRHLPQFSWDAEISCFCSIFNWMLIFYDFAWFCAANICVYFQYLFMHCVYTNIFWRNCFNRRFKIDVVVMIIWSIVIIINFVLTPRPLVYPTIASLAK